jgi:hypothetical protein
MAAISIPPPSFSGGFRVHTELVWGLKGGENVSGGQILKLQPAYYQILYYSGAKADKCNQYLHNRHTSILMNFQFFCDRMEHDEQYKQYSERK